MPHLSADTAIAQPTPIRRLVSIDALRGFDMFWIMGGEEIVHLLAKVTHWGWAEAFAQQLTHVAWNGYRAYDNIFPLFLFLAGVSTPFSFDNRLARGDSRSRLAQKVIQRGLTLVLLGIIYNNGLFVKSLAEMRFPSVLARIGLAGMFAQLIYLYVRNDRARYGIFMGILLGYWALLMLVPVPGFGAGNLTMEGSLVGYIDRMLLPGHLHRIIHDPEGILSTLPAIGTALMGIFTGQLLRHQHVTHVQKAIRMALAGAVCLAVGWVWDSWFPVNKNLWTSSFVLVAGGWSLLMLALFYWIIDVQGWKRWTFFFVVIGTNSILIYLADEFINFAYTSKALFGGLLGFLPAGAAAVGAAIAFVLVKWLFLLVLYRKNIFLRV